jgi:hypothetical protein
LFSVRNVVNVNVIDDGDAAGCTRKPHDMELR